MNQNSNKHLEALIYAGLWMIAIILFLLDIMRARSYTNLPLLDLKVVLRLTLTLLPFMVLFALNNGLLIPRLLKRGLYAKYFLAVLCLIGVIWCWQKFQFFNIFGFQEIHSREVPPHHNGPHPLLPLPLFLDAIYDVLIVGVNLAVSLLFQQFADRLKHESLQKENAENQLVYLKAQINPHFYMNMLNNIHGMIEIDPAKAQDMVIEMSRLMRYMLYESSRPEIELKAEIRFIEDYLALMRVRYHEDYVSISTRFPKSEETNGILIPPLLFLVFLENAFKHGISYSNGSFVSVSISLEDKRIMFSCINSMHKTGDYKKGEGIGLENVKRRLKLIYGYNYQLEIDKTESVYTVNLTIPIYETENTDNR